MKTAKKRRPKAAPRKHAKKNGARKASRSKQRPAQRVTARVNTIQFKIGPKKNIRNVRLMPQGGPQGSSYQPILDEIAAKLKKRGDLFEVEIPSGLSSRVFHNRMNAMLRRARPKLPGKLKVKKSTVEGGKKIALIAV